MEGWAAMGPFDGIIVTAGALEIPDVLLRQLKMPEGMKSGGRMIIPVGGRQEQVMTLVMRTGADQFESVELEAFRFVPLLGKTIG